jgi:hypothetical protein
VLEADGIPGTAPEDSGKPESVVGLREAGGFGGQGRESFGWSLLRLATGLARNFLKPSEARMRLEAFIYQEK